METKAPTFPANHRPSNVACQPLGQSARSDVMTQATQEERFHSSARTVEIFVPFTEDQAGDGF